MMAMAVADPPALHLTQFNARMKLINQHSKPPAKARSLSNALADMSDYLTRS